MTPHAPVKGLLFTCDQQGNILKILRDDNNMFSAFGSPFNFFALFDLSCQRKSIEFWNKLKQESTVLDWELIAAAAPSPEHFKFSGFVTGSEIFITASKYDKALLTMFNELMSMNNEQANLLRHAEKSLSVLKKTKKIDDIDILNEMTLLNNELVNSQRKLVKQNAEITRLNNQLKLVNAELEQFTYVASHDLKEPLRMITGFMELLKKRYENPVDDNRVKQKDEKALSYINYALTGGKRMEKMIGDLLELSRTGRKNAIKELTDLNNIVIEVKQNIFMLLQESHAEIIIQSALPVLPVYKADITSLLQNLLSNAIKFRIKEVIPVVMVDVKEQEDEWLFSVTDNGIGIEKDKFEKIFEIFGRLHSKEAYEGTGIGLAVCKKVAEHHDGKIWVESEKGKGSTFFFTIKK